MSFELSPTAILNYSVRKLIQKWIIPNARSAQFKTQNSKFSTLWFSSHCALLFRQFIAFDDAMVFQVNAVKGESQGFQGLFSYRRFQLAFPNRYAMPTHFCKLALFLQVTVTIALYLCSPETHICLWKHIILTAFMPMPETFSPLFQASYPSLVLTPCNDGVVP